MASAALQSIIDLMRARPSYKTFTVEELRAGLVKIFTQCAPPSVRP